MIFTTKEADCQRLLKDGHPVLKINYANGVFVDAWIGEEVRAQAGARPGTEVRNEQMGVVQLNMTGNGLFGSLEVLVRPGGPEELQRPEELEHPEESDNALAMEEITKDAYRRIFDCLSDYPDLRVIRYWNFVPDIVRPVGAAGLNGDGENVYQLFNAGRYKAFRAHYGDALDTMAIPAASAVGMKGSTLRIEFLAVPIPVAMIENKDQVPAYRYPEQYGKIPPFFSRGVIFDNNGQRLLLSSGTASITGEKSLHAGDIYEQLCQSIHNLRILGSQFNLKKYDIHYGFALEDIVLLRVYYKQASDRIFLERMVPKFLAPSCRVSFQQADICREELLVELEALFVKKGETERGFSLEQQGMKAKYRLEADLGDGSLRSPIGFEPLLPALMGNEPSLTPLIGVEPSSMPLIPTEDSSLPLIRTESFEIHVAEHCNLTCRDCCNISPFNAKKFISLEEVAEICAFVSTQFRPDVFKIAGGEPTLHPQLDDILKIVKRTLAGVVVRVISNGLLLHRMTEDFWLHIDQLTISNYISAPVKPRLLEEIRRKARQYEVVLNIKYVDQFNEIFVDDAIENRERVQEIYDDCWMRHRCLIIRNGRFYKCTRAAYMDEFLQIKKKPIAAGESSYSVEDGIALDDLAFRDKALSYLNDEKPLLSCEYCLGVSGGLRENVQMGRVK